MFCTPCIVTHLGQLSGVERRGTKNSHEARNAWEDKLTYRNVLIFKMPWLYTFVRGNGANFFLVAFFLRTRIRFASRSAPWFRSILRSSQSSSQTPEDRVKQVCATSALRPLLPPPQSIVSHLWGYFFLSFSVCLLAYLRAHHLLSSSYLGIYRNAVKPELQESLSPKVKTMYDLFKEGTVANGNRKLLPPDQVFLMCC